MLFQWNPINTASSEYPVIPFLTLVNVHSCYISRLMPTQYCFLSCPELILYSNPTDSLYTLHVCPLLDVNLAHADVEVLNHE